MTSPPKVTNEMLGELEDFLMSENAPEDCMQLSDLDGFLAGVVVGPDLIMPSEWVPVIWVNGEPNFDDEKQAARIMGTIMGRYNEIIHQLDDEPGTYMPIVYSDSDGRLQAADWAEGFMDAFGLRVDAWDPLFSDEDHKYLMAPIMALLHDKDGKPFINGTLEEMKEIRKESSQSLPFVIKDIYDYWKARRDPLEDTEALLNDNSRIFGKKVGRNKQCPCGSGRKYKRCCGTN